MMATEHDEDPVTELLDPLVLRARQRVGQVLREKWHLDVLLGVGGTACVYAATHRNGSRVAVKMLHQELAIHPEVRARFLREGYVANAVGHDGAVKVSDDDTAADGSPFLVMELLDGETLEERRARAGGRLGEDEVLSIADQVLDVLVAAHSKGVIHRDLKPENVFLTRDGRVKVLDFGIARLRELSPTASTATRGGASMGTPQYMPHEQARGRWDEVDGRSDLWAVGATMFELLSGRRVHDGGTVNEVLLAAMMNRAPPVASVAPSVAPAVGYVVDKALRFERERRWPDAASMQAAVRSAYYDRHGAPITTAPKITVPPEVPNRTLPGIEGTAMRRLPTTAQPVAHSRPLAARALARLSPSRRRLAVAGAAAGLVVLGAGLAVASLARTPRGAAASSAPEVVASAPVSVGVPAAAPPASAPPTLAVTELPSAPAAPPPAAPTPTPLPRPTAAPRAVTSAVAPPSAKPNCNPPYVLDSEGHTRWKPECF